MSVPEWVRRNIRHRDPNSIMGDSAMNGIMFCGDHYAAIKNGRVVGVISRSVDGLTWGWHRTDGSADSSDHLRLSYAFDIALRCIKEPT